MTDREARKAELKALFPAAKKPRAPRARATPATAGNTIIVNGDGLAAHQIVAGDLHHHTYARAPTRPRIVVTPGNGVIDDSQKAALAALRAEWMFLHAALKKTPLSDAAAWARINKAAGATSYHLITPENFPRATAYISRQMAILRNMASAPAKDIAWRNSRIAAIKARCANQLADQDFYKPYILRSFNLGSLTELATDQLRQTYTYIMGKKPTA